MRRTILAWTVLLVTFPVIAPAVPTLPRLEVRAVTGSDDDDDNHHRFPVWDRDDLRGGRLAPIMTSDGVLFRLRDDEARHVTLVGEFNDWNEDATPLEPKRDGLWKTAVELTPGKWGYLFVVDGEWVRDPDNPIVRRDESTSMGDVSFIHVESDRISLPRPYGAHEGSFDVSGSFDRVNQVTLGAAMRYENRVELHPALEIGGAYSFGQKQWLYDVSVVQPLIGDEVLDLGVDAYRRTATPDEFRIGDFENSLFAFFFHEDWRDYHAAEGVGTHARIYVGSAVGLGVRWTSERHRSLDKTTDWALFGGNKGQRENPEVDEGQLRQLTAFWELDTRNSKRNPTRGFLALAQWSWAGDEFGGDFEFQYFDFRLMGGIADHARRTGPDGVPLDGYAAVPVQERFYLGGMGTMRATLFKSLQGDRMVLGNAEMRLEIFDDFQAAVFVDAGDAWVDEDANLDLKWDAGVGFQDSDGSLRLNVAKKMDRGNQPDIFVTARLQRMF
jgi:hypothetical protein